jgi:hypothetical protein
MFQTPPLDAPVIVHPGMGVVKVVVEGSSKPALVIEMIAALRPIGASDVVRSVVTMQMSFIFGGLVGFGFGDG